MPRRLRSHRAFTLIELLVVVLIVAILIAVALPSFLGQTAKAQDSAVMQRLAVTRTEAKAIWTSDGQSAYPATATLAQDLGKAEPAYSFVSDSGAASVASIGVSVLSASIATFCQQSQSGTVFCLRADETGGLYDLSGSQAAAPAEDPLTAASAQAADGYTDMLESEGPTESAATCVLDAGTPTAGGTGTIPSTCLAKGGQAGWSMSATATITPATSVAGPPSIVTPPSITGAAGIGQTLTASPGSYSGTPTPALSYQWQDCTTTAATSCTNISGATGETYTTTPADGQQAIRFVVTADNTAGRITADSPTTALLPESYDQLVAADGAADYYKLSEPAGATRAADSAQFLNASTSITGVSFGSPGYGAGMTAASFTNTTANPSIATPPLQPASDAFTEEAWIHTTASGEEIFSSRTATDPNADSLTLGVGLAACPAGTLTFGVNTNNIWTEVCSTQTVNTGSWVYVTGVFSSTTGAVASPSQFSIYINGVKATTGGQAPANFCANASTYTGPAAPLGGSTGTQVDANGNCSASTSGITLSEIGGDSALGNYSGLMERVAIYDKALTAQQIAAHYADGAN